MACTSKKLGGSTDFVETVAEPQDHVESFEPLAFDKICGVDKAATKMTRLLTDSLATNESSLVSRVTKKSGATTLSRGLRRRGVTFELHPRSSMAAPILHASEFLGEASIFSCVVSLTNTCIGAGILGLPYSISKLGLLLGVFTLCIVCVLTASLIFMAMSASKTMIEGTTFSDIGWKTFPNVMKVIDAMNGLGYMGACIAYLVIVGDVAPYALKHIVDELGGNSDSFFLKRNVVIALFSVVLLLPVIRARYLDNMKIVSVFAIVCFAFILCVTFFTAAVPSMRSYARENAPEEFGTGDWFWIPHSSVPVIIAVLPIVTLAFNCVPNAIALTHELKDNTFKRLVAVIFWTMLICLTVYGFVGVSVYLTFGNKVQSDFLLNYPNDSWIFTIARLAFAFAVCMSYPLVMYVVREAVAFIVLKRSAIDPQTTDVQFYTLTYGIFATTFGVAMVTTDLGMIMAMAGVFSSISCTFIVPGLLFYYRCTPKGGPVYYSPAPDSGVNNRLCEMSTETSVAGGNISSLSGRMIMSPSPGMESPSTRQFGTGTPKEGISTPLMESTKDGGVDGVVVDAETAEDGASGIEKRRKSRLASVYEAAWNVWPNWMARFSVGVAAFGVLMVPLFCSVQFI